MLDRLERPGDSLRDDRTLERLDRCGAERSTREVDRERCTEREGVASRRLSSRLRRDSTAPLRFDTPDTRSLLERLTDGDDRRAGREDALARDERRCTDDVFRLSSPVTFNRPPRSSAPEVPRLELSPRLERETVADRSLRGPKDDRDDAETSPRDDRNAWRLELLPRVALAERRLDLFASPPPSLPREESWRSSERRCTASSRWPDFVWATGPESRPPRCCRELVRACTNRLRSTFA